MTDGDKFIVRTAAITLCAIIAIVGGCAAHSNTYDEAREKAAAEHTRASAEVQRARNEIELEQIAAIERLIKEGHNPISAACAIKGFDEDHIGCNVAAARE